MYCGFISSVLIFKYVRVINPCVCNLFWNKLEKKYGERVSDRQSKWGKILCRYTHTHTYACIYVSIYLLRFGYVVVQLLSHVWLFTTPWTAACQASLSFTISWSLLKLMSISHWCHPTISSLSSPSLLALKLTQHPGLF